MSFLISYILYGFVNCSFKLIIRQSLFVTIKFPNSIQTNGLLISTFFIDNFCRYDIKLPIFQIKWISRLLGSSNINAENIDIILPR